MSLFFVAVGMSVDLGALAAEPLRFAAYLGALLAIKIGLLYGLARLFGSGRADAVRVAFMLGQAGEFGFILFGAAKVLNLIDNAVFVAAVTVISLSMLLTPLLVRAGSRLAEGLGDGDDAIHRRFRYHADGAGEQPPRVVVAGYGRVGHTIGAVLASHGIPYIAFDANPAAVARWRGEGLPVYYGDIRDPNLLEAAKVQEAEVVVLTIDDPQASIEATTLVRAHAPAVTIVARARDLVACDALFRAGASTVFPEAVEASLRLAAETLQGLGVSDQVAEAMLQAARGEDYALVRAGVEPAPIVPASDASAK
jgi:glutathione-regulated potassium-efflux system protein KefB